MCQHIGMLVYIFDLAYVIENRCSIIHSGLLNLLNLQTKYIYLFNIFQLIWAWYNLKKIFSFLISLLLECVWIGLAKLNNFKFHFKYLGKSSNPTHLPPHQCPFTPSMSSMVSALVSCTNPSCPGLPELCKACKSSKIWLKTNFLNSWS